MNPVFREDKATQVASRLLQLSGNRLSILKLVKLVYLADRASLERFGRPITFDKFYAMAHGPIVSSTMDCINASDVWPNSAPIWTRFISQRDGNEVSLVEPAPPRDLSRAEEAIIDEVFGTHGHKTPWELANYTHGLAEYHDPTPNKRQFFRYRDVLRAVGWNDEDIRAATADLIAETKAAQIVG